MGRPGSASLNQARANLASVAHTLQGKQGLQRHAKAFKAYLAGQLRLTWTHAGESLLLVSCILFSCAWSLMWQHAGDLISGVVMRFNK